MQERMLSKASHPTFSIIYLSTILMCWSPFVSEGLPDRSCIASIETARVVDVCPTKKSEYDAARIRKNCANVTQHCTEKSNFDYYCVPDSWNRLIELCAVTFYSTNERCIEFNIGGARLQNNDKKCLDCPTRLISTEMYKHESCYHGHGKMKTTIMVTTEPNTTKDVTALNDSRVPQRTSSKYMLFILLIIPVLMVLAAVVFFYKFRTNHEQDHLQARETERLRELQNCEENNSVHVS